jgi:hypothetical protein
MELKHEGMKTARAALLSNQHPQTLSNPRRDMHPKRLERFAMKRPAVHPDCAPEQSKLEM